MRFITYLTTKSLYYNLHFKIETVPLVYTDQQTEAELSTEQTSDDFISKRYRLISWWERSTSSAFCTLSKSASCQTRAAVHTQYYIIMIIYKIHTEKFESSQAFIVKIIFNWFDICYNIATVLTTSLSGKAIKNGFLLFLLHTFSLFVKEVCLLVVENSCVRFLLLPLLFICYNQDVSSNLFPWITLDGTECYGKNIKIDFTQSQPSF